MRMDKNTVEIEYEDSLEEYWNNVLPKEMKEMDRMFDPDYVIKKSKNKFTVIQVYCAQGEYKIDKNLSLKELEKLLIEFLELNQFVYDENKHKAKNLCQLALDLSRDILKNGEGFAILAIVNGKTRTL